jgi:CubicO group peptidase (beta-lactamase class C family)
MLTRRTFLQGSASLVATAMVCGRAGAVNGEPIRTIQNRIDRLCRRAFNERDARTAIVVGVVTPDTGSNGQLLFAGRDTLVNPFGDKLVLDARTPFPIGSTSKVFTSGIHYMLHGPYEGSLGTWLGSRMTMSKGVADLQLRNLAIYEPGLAQDNEGGVYPRDMMRSLRNLFDYMADFVPPYAQGACYAYSNIGWALLSMASLRLNSLDTDVFTAEYDQRLKQFCSRFGASDTSVFHPDVKPRLPIGYNRRLEALRARNPYRPSFPAGNGSGGIVSTGADMLRYLLYNMGRLPGGMTDRALAYQQTETFQVPPCSTLGRGPRTSYGWFHTLIQTPSGSAVVLNKNGGVRGFTSWMGFTSWQGAGIAATHGAFVLSNGLRSTRIGMNAMRALLAPLDQPH